MANKLLEALGRELRYVEYKVRQHRAKRKREKEKQGKNYVSPAGSSNFNQAQIRYGNRSQPSRNWNKIRRDEDEKQQDLNKPAMDPWGIPVASNAKPATSPLHNAADSSLEKLKAPNSNQTNPAFNGLHQKDTSDLLQLNIQVPPKPANAREPGKVENLWDTFAPSQTPASVQRPLSNPNPMFSSFTTNSAATSAPGDLENVFDSLRVADPSPVSPIPPPNHVLLPDNVMADVFQASTVDYLTPSNNSASEFLGGKAADLVNFSDLVSHTKPAATPRELFKPKVVAVSMNALRGAPQQSNPSMMKPGISGSGMQTATLPTWGNMRPASPVMGAEHQLNSDNFFSSASALPTSFSPSLPRSANPPNQLSDDFLM